MNTENKKSLNPAKLGNEIKTDVITRFSGDERLKLQKHFTSLYGTDKMAQEKANSFAVGFGKACDMIISALNE